MKLQYKLTWIMIVVIILFTLMTVLGCRIERRRDPAPPPQTQDPQGPIGGRTPNEDGPQFQGGTESESRKITEDVIEDFSVAFPELVFLSGSRRTNQVALTFDDGPDDYFTPQVLDVLQQHGVKATFFVTGVMADAYPDVLRRMVNEGHVVGNHTYHHGNMARMTKEEIINDVRQAEQAIYSLTGIKTALFRSPYGALSVEGVKILEDKGYKIIGWSVDSLDWKELSAEQVLANVFSNINKGAIILQHSAGGPGQDLSGTVEALPQIIEDLKAQGYTFVTVDKLLNLPAYK